MGWSTLDNKEDTLLLVGRVNKLLVNEYKGFVDQTSPGSPSCGTYDRHQVHKTWFPSGKPLYPSSVGCALHNRSRGHKKTDTLVSLTSGSLPKRLKTRKRSYFTCLQQELWRFKMNLRVIQRHPRTRKNVSSLFHSHTTSLRPLEGQGLTRDWRERSTPTGKYLYVFRDPNESFTRRVYKSRVVSFLGYGRRCDPYPFTIRPNVT